MEEADPHEQLLHKLVAVVAWICMLWVAVTVVVADWVVYILLLVCTFVVVMFVVLLLLAAAVAVFVAVDLLQQQQAERKCDKSCFKLGKRRDTLLR